MMICTFFCFSNFASVIAGTVLKEVLEKIRHILGEGCRDTISALNHLVNSSNIQRSFFM
jgi:hypothetical protein